MGERLPGLIGDIHASIVAGREVKALLASGAFDLAEAELGSLTLPPTTADTVGMIGMVTMTRALIAAADQRPGDVAAPMQIAKELAAQFGELDDNRDRLGFGFGPTNVGLWEMALALEAGESDRAVGVTQVVKPERHPFKTRQSQYWMDYGRALARRCGAVRTTRCASAAHRRGAVPDVRVLRNPFARDVIGELVVRSRRDAVGRELRGTAYRVGLSV